MNTFKIIKPYSAQYKSPIVLRTGDEVMLGKEEQEEKWKGWLWAESENCAGWVPIQILQLSEDKRKGKVLEFYSAKELDVEAGDDIIKIRSLNGWTWSKNLRTNDEGWNPVNNIYRITVQTPLLRPGVTIETECSEKYLVAVVQKVMDTVREINGMGKYEMPEGKS